MKTPAALLLFALLPACAFAEENEATPATKTPLKEGPRYRTHAENYKDMILARCIARVYGEEGRAGRDAYGVASRLFESTCYDMETTDADDGAGELIGRYIGFDYRSRHFTQETGIDVPFNLGKCIELYRSKALEEHVRKHVCEPDKISGGFFD
jgi:hypothetical protein